MRLCLFEYVESPRCHSTSEVCRITNVQWGETERDKNEAQNREVCLVIYITGFPIKQVPPSLSHAPQSHACRSPCAARAGYDLRFFTKSNDISCQRTSMRH